MTETKIPQKKKKASLADKRAANLRANLKRRKQQTRDKKQINEQPHPDANKEQQENTV